MFNVYTCILLKYTNDFLKRCIAMCAHNEDIIKRYTVVRIGSQKNPKDTLCSSFKLAREFWCIYRL